MSTAKSKEYRKELAEMFARILEEKELDWKKEWKGLANVPINAVKGRKYKGINAFALMLIMMERGYTDPRFATFNQIKEMGCKLHDAKGKGVRVEYWFPYDREARKAITWEEFRILSNGKLDDRFTLYAKYSTVFNAAHIEGLPERKIDRRNDISADDLISKLAENMEVEILNDGGDRAFYRLSEDKIHLPIPEVFSSRYAYNSTALHELAHATGAPHRLNRKFGAGFGSEDYAYEELIAEITSCFMSTNLDLEQDEVHLDNHKAYIQSWIKAIREKPESLTKAIAEAEKTAAYMEYKAELIPEYEYQKTVEAVMEITVNEEPSVQENIKEDAVVARTVNDVQYRVMYEIVGNSPIRYFLDIDGTAAVFKTVDTLETLYEKGYFLNLEPIQNVVDAVNYIIENYPEIEVYVMSSVLPNSKYALHEKNQWIDRYLPKINKEHRIFPPCGENKLDYIPGGVRETDLLMDDYTHNLTLWEPPARAVKLLNGINHTRETWRGNRLRYDKTPEELAENIVDIALNDLIIKDIRPQDKQNDLERVISGMEKNLKNIKTLKKQLVPIVQAEEPTKNKKEKQSRKIVSKNTEPSVKPKL